MAVICHEGWKKQNWFKVIQTVIASILFLVRGTVAKCQTTSCFWKTGLHLRCCWTVESLGICKCCTTFFLQYVQTTWYQGHQQTAETLRNPKWCGRCRHRWLHRHISGAEKVSYIFVNVPTKPPSISCICNQACNDVVVAAVAASSENELVVLELAQASMDQHLENVTNVAK